HIQPAVEALMGLCRDEKIAPDEVIRIDVDTYRIAAEHAHTGWDDFASAQLSFPYLIGLALLYRAIRLEHFGDDDRRNPGFREIPCLRNVGWTPGPSRVYPKLGRARVKVNPTRCVFTRQGDQARGSRLVPLDDAGLGATVDQLVGAVLSRPRAA